MSIDYRVRTVQRRCKKKNCVTILNKQRERNMFIRLFLSAIDLFPHGGRAIYPFICMLISLL